MISFLICVSPSCFLRRYRQKRAASTYRVRRGPPEPEQIQQAGPQKCSPTVAHLLDKNWRFLPTVQYYIPGHAGLCQDQVTLKLPCTSIFGVDGRTKLLNNILCRSVFFNFRTGFFGVLTAGVPNFHCKKPLSRVY